MKLFHANVHQALMIKRMFKDTLACMSISVRRECEAKNDEGSPLGGLICVREDAASHLVLIEAALES